MQYVNHTKTTLEIPYYIQHRYFTGNPVEAVNVAGLFWVVKNKGLGLICKVFYSKVYWSTFGNSEVKFVENGKWLQGKWWACKQQFA